MGFEGIGASVRRKEDHRFLAGRGNYTDDINRPGQLHAVIRRSDRPHARLLGVDATAAAKAAPGVLGVFVGRRPGGGRNRWHSLRLARSHNKDGTPMKPSRSHPVLAVGKVRHVGDPGRRGDRGNPTKQEAKDAAELLVD